MERNRQNHRMDRSGGRRWILMVASLGRRSVIRVVRSMRMVESNKRIWNLDVSRLTPAGWIVSLGSSGIAVAAMFSALHLLHPHGFKAKTAGWVGVIALAVTFIVFFAVGTGILRVFGLTLTKLTGQVPAPPRKRLAVPRLALQFLGALLGASIAFGLGLAFNTGLETAQFEIAIYVAVGAIAGWFAGLLIHIVFRP